MGNLYRFTEPVVLYALRKHGRAHGYELANALEAHALTDSKIDRGALYRTLQQLEVNGHVTSTWEAGDRGPARHTYELTERGVRHLAEWTVVLENLSSSLRRFLEDVRTLEDDEHCSPGA